MELNFIEGKTEPGDDSDIKFAASFQATQSNINRAHGGKLPRYYDIVVKGKVQNLFMLLRTMRKEQDFGKNQT